MVISLDLDFSLQNWSSFHRFPNFSNDIPKNQRLKNILSYIISLKFLENNIIIISLFDNDKAYFYGTASEPTSP